jgi:hypothetical protein
MRAALENMIEVWQDQLTGKEMEKRERGGKDDE